MDSQEQIVARLNKSLTYGKTPEQCDAEVAERQAAWATRNAEYAAEEAQVLNRPRNAAELAAARMADADALAVG